MAMEQQRPGSRSLGSTELKHRWGRTRIDALPLLGISPYGQTKEGTIAKRKELDLLLYESREEIRKAWRAGRRRIKVGDVTFQLKASGRDRDYITASPVGERLTPVLNFPISEEIYSKKMDKKSRERERFAQR